MKIIFSNEEKNKDFLGDGLDSFNSKFNKNIIPYENKKIFGFYAYEKEDEIAGGICGHTDMGNWVHIELLFVDEKYRGKNLGSKLIGKAEEYAKENKHLGIHVNTWQWQAKEFYEKMGFEVFGQLKNHPKDACMYYMKKEF